MTTGDVWGCATSGTRVLPQSWLKSHTTGFSIMVYECGLSNLFGAMCTLGASRRRKGRPTWRGRLLGLGSYLAPLFYIILNLNRICFVASSCCWREALLTIVFVLLGYFGLESLIVIGVWFSSFGLFRDHEAVSRSSFIFLLGVAFVDEIFITTLDAQAAQGAPKAESCTTRSLLMQDWVFWLSWESLEKKALVFVLLQKPNCSALFKVYI